MTTYGLLLFDIAEELDFAGPWEVFTTSSILRRDADTTLLIAEHPDPVRSSKGMHVVPDRTLGDHPRWTSCWCRAAAAPARSSRTTPPSPAGSPGPRRTPPGS
ncbi:hypothetical protein ACFQ0B_55245 [Nonomuraea thailandensis]